MDFLGDCDVHEKWMRAVLIEFCFFLALFLSARLTKQLIAADDPIKFHISRPGELLHQTATHFHRSTQLREQTVCTALAIKRLIEQRQHHMQQIQPDALH